MDYEQVLDKHLQASGIPPHLHSGLRMYLVHGYHPGHFLTAVLMNDLTGAVARADDDSIRGLAAVVRFLWNYAPSWCWGSEERVKDYLAAAAIERMRES